MNTLLSFHLHKHQKLEREGVVYLSLQKKPDIVGVHLKKRPRNFPAVHLSVFILTQHLLMMVEEINTLSGLHY